ncbi:reverse transcriptase (RNA-dependent DNA polymerase) domain-containing protein [Phthorimaea operculella]|nr:reverse transcriptase (RNA-dependent DNA polymerase) domain-containing protein [Phthorimaea operculella]
MENQGILSRTTTPSCSPLTFTLKRDGSVRLDVINSFHGANFISIVDLNNAYFQIPISETSKRYTGFTFNGKSYVYNVLPQGLKTSVGSFSRAMDIILGHERVRGQNHKSWVSILPRKEELYNHTYHESSKFTPCEIMYGETTQLSFDSIISSEERNLNVDKIRSEARENLIKASQNRQGKFNQRYRIIQYQIGDTVKIRRLNRSDAQPKITKKFEPLYEGPYVIASNPFKNVYVLKDPKTKKIRGKFNTIHLSRYYL